MMFWKTQNSGGSSKISGCQGTGESQGRICKAQRIFRTVKRFCRALQRWMHAIIHSSTPIECTKPRVNSNINYGLLVMLCQCRFINYNKCTTLVSDVDNRGDCACVGAGRIWEIFTFCLILLQTWNCSKN